MKKTNEKNIDEKQKQSQKVKPINYKTSKLEKTLKMSSEETLAEAIRDLLIRDEM